MNTRSALHIMWPPHFGANNRSCTAGFCCSAKPQPNVDSDVYMHGELSAGSGPQSPSTCLASNLKQKGRKKSRVKPKCSTSKQSTESTNIECVCEGGAMTASVADKFK